MSSNQIANRPSSSSAGRQTEEPSPPRCIAYHERDPKTKTDTMKFTIDMIGVDAPDDQLLMQMFKHFDKSGDGKIDKREFMEFYRTSFDDFGCPPTEKDVQRLFESVDKDRSGTLSFDEFALMICHRMKM